MMIEAYGAEGAIALSAKYSYDFLSQLLNQTAELRKDPEEREKENIKEWVEENQERSIVIKTNEGETKKFNLNAFKAIA